jgi:threonine dehydrogenase-like Zn-dependent dehydrogenase
MGDIASGSKFGQPTLWIEMTDSPVSGLRDTRNIFGTYPSCCRSDDMDRSFVVTHPASPEDVPAKYKKFRDEEDGVIKVFLRPGS